VRQLAAAFEGGINLCKSIDCNQGASRLAHSKAWNFSNLDGNAASDTD
jgi:hypothetical protein